MSRQQSKANRNTWPPPRRDVKPKQKQYIYGEPDNTVEDVLTMRDIADYMYPEDADPLVYIANVGMHDYSATFEWTPLGSAGVRKVTSGDIDRKNPERLVWNVVHGLRNFRPQDYFVFSGSPLPFAIGLSYLLNRFQEVQVLYYLKSKNAYFPITYTWEMFERAESIEFETESIVPDNEDAEYPTY